jgi:hypothetical protein
MAISKITKTTKGNVRLLDSSDNILHQISRAKTVYLDEDDSEIIYIANVINEHKFNPKQTIKLSPSQITSVGGSAFSGDAQDLIDELDAYFFG